MGLSADQSHKPKRTMEDHRSLSHTKWQCKYHIVFIPKYQKRHMLINVPPKLAVSSVVRYIKGKSAIHVARHFLKRERNYAGQRIWARGFFVDTVGRDTETIRKHIAEQEMEDRRLDQLEMPEITRE